VRKRDPLRGASEIALAVAEVLNTRKMPKHFDLDITDAAFGFTPKAAKIATEAATDGLYVVRTNLAPEMLGDAETVRSYNPWPWWNAQSAALLICRSSDASLAGRSRARALCMLAYYRE
jgi:hypothetical protein